MSRITHVDSSRLLLYGLLPEIQQTHEAGNQLDTVTRKFPLVASLTLKKVFDMVKASPTHPLGNRVTVKTLGRLVYPSRLTLAK